jgi:hypothetical protein
VKTLTPEKLENLLRREEGICISLYLPMEKMGKGTLQNPSRLRRMLGQARDGLRLARINTSAREALLQPAADLLDDYYFWQHQEPGLAMFLSGGRLDMYKVPCEVPEMAVIGPGFHLKPLLPVLARDGELQILSLSKNAVKLYRSSRYDIEEVPLEGVPQSEEDALRYDNPEESIQWHYGARGDGGERSSIFHGHGAAPEEAKGRALRYFLKIDRSLKPRLDGKSTPLILACVDYYLPIYREANTYPHLMDSVIPGNPEGLRPEELRDAAWDQMKARLDAEVREGLEKLNAGYSKGLSEANLDAAVAAACHGRVNECFFALNTDCWGAFHHETAAIERLDRQDPRARDLIDLAAVQTLAHGGRIYPLDTADSLNGSPLAVTLRYAAGEG